ncbi:hypothetical protein EON64_07765 [archaeon]|nr:MAG: hypothetical protein EON64_07765 [archaeon]
MPSIKPQDSIIISTSNGGSVLLGYETICLKAQDDVEFDVAVQNVPLASSLKISLHMDGPQASSRGRGAGQKTLYQQASEIVLLISQDRALGISLVLSGFVLLTGLRSVHSLSADIVLLLLFAVALALYNIVQTLEACYAEQAAKAKSSSLRLVIHAHAFTSPDVPVIDADNEIPRRFIDGCDGDLKEARQRWDITRHWCVAIPIPIRILMPIPIPIPIPSSLSSPVTLLGARARA